MSIEQGDRIGWICPECKMMCHSYDVVCACCGFNKKFGYMTDEERRYFRRRMNDEHKTESRR